MLLIGCAPIYNPNAINSPLFTKQNDAQLQGSIGLSDYGLQVAYTQLTKPGVMVNISMMQNRIHTTGHIMKEAPDIIKPLIRADDLNVMASMEMDTPNFMVM